MPEAERREVDKMLRGLAPKLQRQLSVSSSNALERFSVVEAVLQHRKLVLLLDYDGTLTPIVQDPSKALLSERVKAILRELPKLFITGVISGRSLGKIRAFVDVKGLFYAGSHGFDILAPSHSVYSGSLGLKREEAVGAATAIGGGDGVERGSGGNARGASDKTDVAEGDPSLANGCGGVAGSNGGGCTVQAMAGVVPATASGRGDGESERMDDSGSGVLEEVRHQVAQEYLPVMATIRDQLIAELKDIKKSEVEDNRFSVSIHYRNCAREDVPRVREVVERVQSRHERIRMGSGKEVFELQPDIAWDKGKAVLWLLDKLVVPMSRNAPAGGAGAGAAAPGRGEAGGPVDDDEAEKMEEESGKFFTIFIGDDKTDENAFRVLNGDMGEGKMHHDGVGILVSEESRETNAAYTLRNPDEVASFLEKIAELGNKRHCSGIMSPR